EKVAAAYVAGEGHGATVQVTNLVRVLGSPQVQLEVRFAEISRSALRQIGFNFWTRTGGGRSDVVGGILGTGTSLPGLAPDLGSGNGGLGGGLEGTGVPILANP